MSARRDTAAKGSARLELDVGPRELAEFARFVALRIGPSARRVAIIPSGRRSRRLARQIRALAPNAKVSELPALRAPRADVILLAHEDEDALSGALLELADLEAGIVLIPRTSRAGRSLPLFVIAIPKAGTHLLLGLARALGFADGLELVDPPAPAHWYYVEYSNAHTAAPDFFVDTVRRSPFGNRAHPFLRSPALFIYRNPIDVLLSEAHYYHQEGNSAFGAYLRNLDLEARLLRLIDDPWLLGSFRDRIARFVAWLDFPNVIPVSFEELVGSDGGGNDDLRRRTLWSILLKLQVPGDPDALALSLRQRASPTFREGRIGAGRDAFSARVRRRFARLPQDFMKTLGYSGLAARGPELGPARAEEFRRRPLVLSRETFSATPILVERAFLEHDFVRLRERYFAVPHAVGPIDLASLDDAALFAFPNDPRLTALRERLLRGELERHALHVASSRDAAIGLENGKCAS
jgi:hypothetical protein